MPVFRLLPAFQLFHIFPEEMRCSIFRLAGKKITFTERALLVWVIKTFLTFRCCEMVHAMGDDSSEITSNILN